MAFNNLNYIDYIYLAFLILFTIFFALKGATKSINYSLKILLSISIPFLFYKKASSSILTELDIQFFNNLADSNKIFFEIIIFISMFLIVYIAYSILEKAINIKPPSQLEFKIIDIVIGGAYGFLIFTFLFYISFSIFLNKHIIINNPFTEFNISIYEKLLNKKTDNNLNINEKNNDKVPKENLKKTDDLY
jgi:hypothetical protein